MVNIYSIAMPLPGLNKKRRVIMSEAPDKSSTGLQPNVAGLLCYLFGWITGLIFLLIEKES